MNDIELITASVESITPKLPMEKVLEVMNAIDFQKRQWKELEARMESYVIEWIKENKQDIVIGTKRYFIGVTKTTKCNDNSATLDALYRACEGEVDKVVQCLASGAFKHGACKKVLPPEVYDNLFTTTEKEKLDEKDGKPVKELKMIDVAFIR